MHIGKCIYPTIFFLCLGSLNGDRALNRVYTLGGVYEFDPYISLVTFVRAALAYLGMQSWMKAMNCQDQFDTTDGGDTETHPCIRSGCRRIPQVPINVGIK